jgi:flagellar biosynthesis/type III secretory pathway chaperone
VTRSVSAAAPDRAAFIAGLEQEVAGLGELCRILQAEQHYLLEGDAEALPALTDAKSRAVEHLVELGSLRNAYLDSRRLPPGTAGMEQWLVSQAGGERARLEDAWSRVLALTADARAANRINGGLIGTRLGYAQAALATLQSTAPHHSGYGPDGQSDFRVGNRELARA